jgi:NAD(P)-dependent dehydrogenase (short-subunit alcohol dehydrogenase family)
VVNVSSLASSDPFQGFFAYAASKAALDSFVRSMHREGARHGIRAFSVNPGAVETPLLRSNFPVKVVPASAALAPEAVAMLIVDCIEGRREADRGKTIEIRK